MVTEIPRTRSGLVPLLEARGLRLRRRHGQSFLVDPALADAIVADAGVGPRDAVIEIGPGAGALTQPLLAAAGRVTAIEIDHGLVDLLREHLGDHPRLRLVHGDCLDAAGPGGLHPAVTEALGGARAAGFDRALVVGNLPYSAGSEILARVVSLEPPPDAVVAMLQAEMVERVRAAPGTRDYGPLAIAIALVGTVAAVRRVPPHVFFPRPEVESLLFRVTPRAAPDTTADERRRAAALAARAFQHRRKRVAKALHGTASEEQLRAAGIDPDVSPEMVAPDGWVRLARLG